VNIQDAINNDIANCWTYDLAYLRMQEPFIPVFLWDNMKNYLGFTTKLKGVDYTKETKYPCGSAETVNPVVPWYSISKNPKEPYEAYCVGVTDDLEYMDLPKYMLGDPLKLKGTLLGLSVKAIRHLDEYYKNQLKFTRQTIEVTPKRYSSISKDTGTDTMDVYAYFNELEDISDFNEDKKAWVIKSHLDFSPFNIKDNVYEM
jgi:hypothetical protein